MDRDDSASNPVGSWWIFPAIGLLLVVGGVAYYVLGRPVEPVPPEIAGDPLLVRGREIYLANCVACHGPTGRGDGPLASGLKPPPRNLAQDPWKYGDRPDQVLTVLNEGVKDAQMPSFSGTFSPGDLKAVAAFVFQVAHKPVPEALR